MGISQKPNCGSWDAFTANVERPELSQAVWRYHRKETPQWTLQLYRTHVGQVPDLFALQTLNFLSKDNGSGAGLQLCQSRLCLENPALVQDKGEKSHEQSPGKRILRDGAK